MDEATWAALAATLTLLGLVWTYVSYRRRGAVAAMRALGFTTLPVAAWLTGTLEMFTEIGGSVADWATGLVLSPITWAGIGVAGFGIVLIVISGYLRDRQIARGLDAGGTAPRAERERSLPAGSSTSSGTGSSPVVDDDLADIEAILKRRGIQ
ncbi:cellulose synthase [Nocardioides currus]|uniref:Cellulose synthase n=1 Tax=Nocardioides currus TaxID=2133958 RepID=A0A2R7YTF9_9ACTN|nr:cellulose synthase [Nocardioides currus]PUA79584.1 cellulose synthase [Nocardioides currus]